MNTAFLIGRITKDLEKATTNSGVSVVKFTLAIDRKYEINGEKQTDFINIVAWKGLADNCCKYLKKGSKIAVVGNIQTRSYDATNGSKRYLTEVVASEIEFLDTKKETKEVEKEQIDEEGLPF